MQMKPTKKHTIKQNVESILAQFEATRSNDKLLLLAYWHHIDGINMSNFANEFLEKGTMAESIRRARQLIQEEGRFLPSEDTIEMRKGREVSMRTSINSHREVI